MLIHLNKLVASPFGNKLINSRLILLIITLMSFPPLQVIADGQKTLSLEQAVEKSLRLHPALLAYQYRLNANQAMVKQAAIGEAPNLILYIEDSLGSGEYKAFDSTQTTLSISWILEKELLKHRAKTIESKERLLQIEQEIKQFDIAASTAHKYLAVLALQERLVVAKKAEQQTQVLLKNVIGRVNAGKASLADQLKAEVSLERRYLEIEDLAHKMKAAKRTLSAAWGADNVTFDSVLGALDSSVEDKQMLSFKQLQKAIKKTPSIEYFLSQERIVQSEITLAREEVKNRWRFTAGAIRYERSNDFGLSMFISRPLGKANRNKGKITALNAKQLRYQSESQAKNIALSTRLYVLYEEYNHSLHLSSTLETIILPKLERASSEAQLAYDLGRHSYIAWAALQDDIINTQMELIDIRLKGYNNRIEIERLTGLSLPIASSQLVEEK